MIKFLTSDFKMYKKIDGIKIPNEIDNTNSIVNQIKENLNKNNTILFIASSPNDVEKTESYSSILFEALKLSGISFNNYIILDSRNKEQAKELISNADLIFLSGGSTYTQNLFFKEISLSELLLEFNGVLIGQSAGALNMSKEVFNSPEELDESEPIYFDGLGLTDINIEPHFELQYDISSQEEKFQRDTILEESNKREIFGQCNGSHIIIDENDNIVVYGETYLIKNGNIQLICKNGEKLSINNNSIKLK